MTRSTQRKSDCPKVILPDGTPGTARDLKFGDFVEISRYPAKEPNEFDKEFALFVRLRQDSDFVDLPVCMHADSAHFQSHMLDIDGYNQDYRREQLPSSCFSVSSYESIKILSRDGIAILPLINHLYNQVRKLEDAREATWRKADKFLESILGKRS